MQKRNDEILTDNFISLQPLLKEDGRNLVRSSYFMYRETKSMSRAVRLFIRFVEDWYAKKDDN